MSASIIHSYTGTDKLQKRENSKTTLIQLQA
jgi:hypothetical protein